jgi:large subunit ribosomal protein L32
MAIPRSKHTKGRRNMGRLHRYLKKPVFGACTKCGKPVVPYTVCQNCGFYKGREVINVLAKLDKKERKTREKQMEETGKTKPLSAEELSKK